MFSRVLFATDFSPASDRALDCLARWKPFGLTKVTLAHVHDVHSAGSLEEEILRADTPRIEQQKGAVADRGLWASARVEIGIPYVALDRIALEEGCEALVIGSHGASWLADVMLGSVADAVLRHSMLPVFVIKVNRLVGLTDQECDSACTGMFTDILYPTDLSDESAGALDLVEQACRRFGSRVHLLHILETAHLLPHLSAYREALLALLEEEFKTLRTRLTAAGASAVSCDVRMDHRVRGILRVIEERRPGLVVVGKHGRGHFAELLLGSTSHGVVRLSDAPVLVVPRNARSTANGGHDE